MRKTRRDFALEIGLKLNQLHHLRHAKSDIKCCKCYELIGKGSFYFAELGYKQLIEPIITERFTITKVPVELLRYCIECSKGIFKEYKKEKLL